MFLEQEYLYGPKGRVGVKMKCEFYNEIRDFILNVLDKEDCTINSLIDKADLCFGERFKQEIGFYIYHVKLDMEARGILKKKIDAVKSAT